MRRSVLASVVVLLAACGGDGGGGIGPQTNTCTGTCLVVANQSTTGKAVTEVNYSNCSDPSWGPDRLPGGEELRPGASRGWSVTSGCWDIRAVHVTGGSTFTVQAFGTMLSQGQTFTLVFDF